MKVQHDLTNNSRPHGQDSHVSRTCFSISIRVSNAARQGTIKTRHIVLVCSVTSPPLSTQLCVLWSCHNTHSCTHIKGRWGAAAAHLGAWLTSKCQSSSHTHTHTHTECVSCVWTRNQSFYIIFIHYIFNTKPSQTERHIHVPQTELHHTCRPILVQRVVM